MFMPSHSIGGSATSDAGIGMLHALIDAYSKHDTLDTREQELLTLEDAMCKEVATRNIMKTVIALITGKKI